MNRRSDGVGERDREVIETRRAEGHVTTVLAFTELDEAQRGQRVSVEGATASEVCDTDREVIDDGATDWHATGLPAARSNDYIADALISSTGTAYFSETSAGVTFSVTHLGPGDYQLTISGLGSQAVMPAITPAGGTPFTMTSDVFSAGTVNIVIQSANGQDEQWGFMAVAF